MNAVDWVQEEIQKSKGEFTEVVCPLFSDGLCTIYLNRPSCCHNFPQPSGYCSGSKCGTSELVIGGESESSPECATCKSKCCTSILIPVTVEITAENIVRLLSISCSDCNKIY